MGKEKVKKPFYKKWWFWLIVVIIIGAIGASGGDKNESTNTSAGQKPGVTTEEKDEKTDSEETIYQIGEPFQVGKLEVTILNVEEKTEFTSDNMFIEDVTTDGKFIAVTARITNNDTKARTFSSSMFKIIDDQSREFETLTDINLMTILGDNNLFLESCNPGMSRTGVFVFEVPKDIESYSLKVYSGTALAATSSVTVKLK